MNIETSSPKCFFPAQCANIFNQEFYIQDSRNMNTQNNPRLPGACISIDNSY